MSGNYFTEQAARIMAILIVGLPVVIALWSVVRGWVQLFATAN